MQPPRIARPTGGKQGPQQDVPKLLGTARAVDAAARRLVMPSIRRAVAEGKRATTCSKAACVRALQLQGLQTGRQACWPPVSCRLSSRMHLARALQADLPDCCEISTSTLLEHELTCMCLDAWWPAGSPSVTALGSCRAEAHLGHAHELRVTDGQGGGVVDASRERPHSAQGLPPPHLAHARQCQHVVLCRCWTARHPLSVLDRRAPAHAQCGNMHRPACNARDASAACAPPPLRAGVAAGRGLPAPDAHAR